MEKKLLRLGTNVKLHKTETRANKSKKMIKELLEDDNIIENQT